MKIYYYYHVPKTGGSSVFRLFKKIKNQNKNTKLYDFNSYDNIKNNPYNINFDEVFSKDNIKKYDVIFIHHHHGYHGLFHYKNILKNKIEELRSMGHTFTLFTTFRNVLSFNLSRINYLKQIGYHLDKKTFLNQDTHYNIQAKYLLFCHQGEWPKGNLTHDVIKQNLNKKNITEILSLMDYIVETKNLNKFIIKLSQELNFNLINNLYINIGKIKTISFNDAEKELLLNNNNFDSLLLKYINY